uniref:Uncharacterized protein n=1 Tax=Amphimedon queenslandica TaxID=400682 RepID=A0A1X7VSK4_AMPQE
MSFQLRLPANKLRCVKGIVAMWLSRNSCTRKKLECFLGHLVQAATVIQPGRTFLRELFKFLHKVKKPHRFIQLTATAKADGGIVFCRGGMAAHSFLFLYLQSIFTVMPPHPLVAGPFAQGREWFSIPWLPGSDLAGITALELAPVVLAPAVCGRFWTGQHVCCHSDSMGVVDTLVSHTSSDSRHFGSVIANLGLGCLDYTVQQIFEGGLSPSTLAS